MKFLKIIGIILTTFVIGYFFIVVLPKIASLGEIENSHLEGEGKKLNSKQNLILRDKCNSFVVENNFSTGDEADSFLQNCLNGKETSSINVIKSPSNKVDESESEITLSPEELLVKCNNFMSHAKFDSEENANKFYNNCLAGK